MQYQNAVAQPRQELTDVIMEGTTSDDQFVALSVLPSLPMQLPNGHVPKITIAKGDLMRATSKKRTPGTTFDRWQSAIDDHTLTLVQEAEEILLPDEQTLIYEDYFAFESVYTKEVGNRLLRSMEMDVQSAIQNTGNFDSNNTGTAWTKANLATMTPVNDLMNAIRLVKGRGERANTFVFAGTIYDLLRQSADMKSFIAGSINPGAIVTGDTIQKAFKDQGITQVLIADAYVNQSQATKNNSVNPIWNNTYAFVGACKAGQLEVGGVGRTFYWEKEGPLLNVSSYRDETRKSNVIRGMKTILADITNTRSGTLITTQYS
jgi:hypothetical protein